MRATSTSATSSATSSGVVRVFPADLNYRGKAIVFTPRLDENKRVVWRCASDEIPARLLPPECRH